MPTFFACLINKLSVSRKKEKKKKKNEGEEDIHEQTHEHWRSTQNKLTLNSFIGLVISLI